MANNELMHFGVKGMHWGIRKDRTTMKKVSEMSDAELNAKINRLNKEKQYKEMTASPIAKLSKKIGTGIIGAAAFEVGKNLVSKYMKLGFSSAGKAAIKIGKEAYDNMLIPDLMYELKHNKNIFD